MAIDTNKEFVTFLEKQREYYMGILERLLGPRDQRFVFGSIGKSTDDEGMPQIHFRDFFHLNGDCVVDIHVSDEAWRKRNYHRAGWQVAHECVHVLDPGERTTNVLEEGLATWFQCKPRYHRKKVKKYIEDYGVEVLLKDCDNYIEARDLVCSCMPRIVKAVRRMRADGVRIRETNTETLAIHLPHVDMQIIEKLCMNFRI